MSRRAAIEAALVAWRDAERRLKAAEGDAAETLTLEVRRHRDLYQILSASHMAEWIAKLTEAEGRRAGATPSTVPFHVAARDTQTIAAEIWEAARSSDEDTPETESNRRLTPRPAAPGSEPDGTEAGDPDHDVAEHVLTAP